jgi:Domain of unknown function (DUF4276)
MARLLIHVEGQTEESFVNEILRNHLVSQGYHSVEARIVGNARLRQQRGGIRKWPSVKRDIVRHLQEDRDCIATTMIDYYGLPQTWPGRERAQSLRSVPEKALWVENALQGDVVTEMGNRFDSQRFVPFVVMHEFEGLLFSDCSAFSQGIGRPDLEVSLREIRDNFPTPEEINDSPLTAPSKRVEGLLPGYEKPLLGVLAVLEIGLSRIRQECPHFDRWIQRLESLAH